MPAHGEHVAGKGWFDASLHGYVDNPARLTPSVTREIRANPLAGMAWRKDSGSPQDVRERQAAELQRTRADTWRPNTQMEDLRRLRAADPVAFDKIAAGRNRMALGGYEQGLRAHLALGRELPDGVTPPDRGAS